MKFSVLISVWNKDNPDYLFKALESILNQTTCPNEIILVHDGILKEKLINVIEYYNNKYPKLLKEIKLKCNQGLGNALKEGIKHCSYGYVARMDADDICQNYRFERQISFLEDNSEVTLVGSNVQEFSFVPGDLDQFRKLPLTNDELHKYSKFRNPINHPTVMFRKSHIIAVGSYEDVPSFEDYFLWLKLLSRGYKLRNMDDSLLFFRIGNDIMDRRSGLRYLKKEYLFLLKVYKNGYITLLDFSFSLFARFCVRMLPKAGISFIYKFLLRS
jgi:glycosyltransferase involved in cell wall biosynthesis